MAKGVKGIGGIFFKCDDPKGLKEWYGRHLGMVGDDHGVLFIEGHSGGSASKVYLQWSPFSKDTDYFKPSDKAFMINYRVEDLELMVEELQANGIAMLDEIETYPYGKFVHLLDPENNKIELWEPIEGGFGEE